MNAGIDTNSLAAGIAGFVRESSIPGAVRAWTTSDFNLVISEHILGELVGVFSKPYFRCRFSPEAVNLAITTLRTAATIVPISAVVEGVASHAEDDLVVATAVSGQARFLVTGDRQLLRVGDFQDIQIVTPREFLDTLGRGRST